MKEYFLFLAITSLIYTLPLAILFFPFKSCPIVSKIFLEAGILGFILGYLVYFLL